MPEDDEKRAADTLEEIRDLLVEIRDGEKERADAAHRQMEEVQRVQVEASRRAKLVSQISFGFMILLIPAMLYITWMVAASLLGSGAPE